MKLMMLFVLFAFLASAQLPPEEKTVCKASVVTWLDATFWQDNDLHIDFDHPENAMATQITFGCVVTTEHVLVVLMNFVQGKPTIVTFIPKEWAISIVEFQPVKEEGK